LRRSARQLELDYPHVDIQPVWGDFTHHFELPALHRAVSRRIVYFPGSTIGNFTPQEAISLLKLSARCCGPGGAMLLGADLKKDPAVITAAYNDRAGVSAEFNLNLLARINRELGADFALDRFWHHAFYTPTEGRIEMHLVSRAEQVVHLGDEAFPIEDGESIRTEYSYKYSIDDIERLAAGAGFELGEVWVDERQYFAVCYLRVAGDGCERATNECAPPVTHPKMAKP
jgi:dimethylhistidine N-methyltransferase